MPPLGSAQFRFEPGGQRLQGILMGRCGKGYRRRFQWLVVLLGRLDVLMVLVVVVVMVVVMVVMIVMVPLLADLLTAGRLWLL